MLWKTSNEFAIHIMSFDAIIYEKSTYYSGTSYSIFQCQKVPTSNKFISPLAGRTFIPEIPKEEKLNPLCNDLLRSYICRDKKIAFEFENASLEEMKKVTLEMWQKNEDLKKRNRVLKEEGFKEEQSKWYIDKLHEYNEIKDVAQMVMGRIAVLEQTTVRAVHEEFGMKDDD
ncbi:hypothetical protein CEXT_174681 [Caerostris extrusa]|uniref:DNA repair protein SWI5 homolog n=1 Tax=Caerostris extrusa TaxID=172846 RepID=A0AAV4P542_CAEEX|nr:hypothetical protein CEXT_174681 [Caerostris extrusa]